MMWGTRGPFREQLKKGFALLAGVGQQHYAEILRGVLMMLEKRQAPYDDLEKRLSLSKEEVILMMGAAVITVPMLTESGAASDEFIGAAVKEEVLPEPLASQIRPFIEVVVKERSQLSRSIHRASMPSQVLPFLANVEMVVDLRMAFDGPTVSEAVPVAVFHIATTGTPGQKIWFQASKSQMEHLRSDIDVTIKQLEAADNWTRGEKEPS